MDEIRFAFRQLLRSPRFAFLAVLTLGIGIGATSAVFGLIQGVLLSPPPYSRPDRLVLISPQRTDGQRYNGECTVGECIEWRQAKNLEGLAAYGWTFNFLILPEGSESVEGMMVTRDYSPQRPIMANASSSGSLNTSLRCMACVSANSYR